MKISSLAAVAIAIACSHFAEAHDVRVGSKGVDESRGKPGKREHHIKHTKPKATADDSSDEDPSLIVGGTDAEVGEFPYYVEFPDIGCGGSLIAPGVVLSAAHCGSQTGRRAIVGGYDSGLLTNGAQEATVTKSLMHPMYNTQPDVHPYIWDVMVLQLDSPVTTPGTKVVINSEDTVPSQGQTMTVFGTGAIAQGGPGSPNLLKLDVAKLDTATCNEPNSYNGAVDDVAMFCAGGVVGEDSCQGDSGGPIVVKEGTTHRQVGIVSWGNGCAQADFPGIYARVSAASSYIAFVACECYGVSDENLCSLMDPNDNFSCEEPTAAPGCQLTGFEGWIDTYGDSCGWYEENDDPGCPEYGQSTSEDGIPATQACCHCQGTTQPSNGGTGGNGGCTDTPGWTDSFGDGCDWYASSGTGCQDFASDVGTDGLTPSEACCVCEGITGTSPPTGGCTDTPGWTDSFGDGCDWYASDEFGCQTFATDVGTDGLTPSEACCVCEGITGTSPPSCVDDAGWTDSFGDGCDWYASSETGCVDFATDVGTDGLTPSEACCVCQGASTATGTSPPTGGGGGLPCSSCCSNVSGWTDSFGDGCDWYANSETGCQEFATDVGTGGLTPLEACCACK